MTRFTHGIAAVSWIDQRVEMEFAVGGPFKGKSLPLNDGAGPPPLLSRPFFKACQGFRFANFLEVGVDVVNGQVTQAGFTPDSTGYFADSFRGKPSHAFSPRRTMTRQGNQLVFRQIVGARTLGAEEAGGDVGDIVGTLISPFGGGFGRKVGKAAARAAAPYAPIWSELEIQINPSGNATGRLLRFSLFPSVNYYEQAAQTPDTLVSSLSQKHLSYGPPHYDAGKWSQEQWFKRGWGGLRGGSIGPTPGNPWWIENDGTDREAQVAA